MALISPLVSPPLSTASMRLRGKESFPSPISPTFRAKEGNFRNFEIVHWRMTVDRRSSGVPWSGTGYNWRDDVVRPMRRN